MPQGFNIGPLTIRFYAILIIIGAIAGAWLAARQAKKHGEDSEIIIDMLPWLLIAGIIGARIWHVFTPSASNIAQGVTTENYLKNPIEILKMWNGGLGIPGGVIGGALALIIYTKARKLNFWQWADFIAPGLLIGQAVGRWGNFINQEVYGRPTDLPWAITIDPRYRIAGFEHVEKYHPL
ncbi:MAG: prolipoprotein diacylglyceryl transferase, partial [Chloroflexi bacterium]|nr:prolipoprotein diacylglyceryl transferase [Chloroflexota bacterium]